MSMRIIWFPIMAMVGMSTMCTGTDIWLNELKVTGTDGDKVEVELVGRPGVTGPTAPESIEATIKYFTGPLETDGIDDSEETIELEADLEPGGAEWNNNYVGLGKCEGGACAAAVGSGGRKGLHLTYGGVTKVYCWGTTGDEVGGKECYKTVSETVIAGTAAGVDHALYNKEASRGSERGSSEESWTWALSVKNAANGAAPFSTLGEVNTAEDSDLFSQTIEAYTYNGPPANTDEEIWLNELNVDSDGKASLEVVGALPVVNNENAPTDVEVTVTFYSSTAVVTPSTGAVVVKLNIGASTNGLNGHYVGVEEDVDVAAAFTDTSYGGLTLTWGSSPGTTVVYCWGPEAGTESTLGGDASLTCTNVVKTGETMSGKNRGLYNWSGTPDDGGESAKDFYWADSKKLSGEAFQTLGGVNACPDGENCAALEDQELDEYEWTGEAGGGGEGGDGDGDGNGGDGEASSSVRLVCSQVAVIAMATLTQIL